MAAKTALLERLALHTPHLSTNQSIPALIYGTAWKKEATTDLVYHALSNGFTAIDTACQPKHYREDLVGNGLRNAINQHSLKRANLYVQTKFTAFGGQDPNNIPYDPRKPLIEQVRQSIEVSLKHLNVETGSASGTYLDTVVLHSPMESIEDTMDVWRTLENYVPKSIHNIGISNCDLFTLMNIYERSTIKPVVVQNRFYRDTKYDIGVRKFCQERNIVYQSFWTLSANPQLLRSKPVQELAAKLTISRESALYCLVLGLGNIVILNGTKNPQHMKDDWAALEAAKTMITSDGAAWKTMMEEFRGLIGERS